VGAAENVRLAPARAKLSLMSAHRIRRQHTEPSRNDDRNSGLAPARAKLSLMSAHRIRRQHTEPSRNDDRSSGVFELPAGARVARRGSTRVEPSTPAEHATPGRGRSSRHDA
jgi:hypothetical protein